MPVLRRISRLPPTKIYGHRSCFATLCAIASHPSCLTLTISRMFPPIRRPIFSPRCPCTQLGVLRLAPLRITSSPRTVQRPLQLAFTAHPPAYLLSLRLGRVGLKPSPAQQAPLLGHGLSPSSNDRIARFCFGPDCRGRKQQRHRPRPECRGRGFQPAYGGLKTFRKSMAGQL